MTTNWKNPPNTWTGQINGKYISNEFSNYKGIYTPGILKVLDFFNKDSAGGSTVLNSTIIELKQSDFTSGTYRITKSGYYKLGENIIFNPNEDNDFMPTDSQTSGGESAKYPVAPYGSYHMGFFAAITIECEDVVIDLNNKILRQSQLHNLEQRFYATIELARQPFIVGQGPADFGNALSPCKNVWIKNGNLGLSSHHGIHGNGAHNIIIENLNIYSFEVAGIAINGGERILNRNINLCNSSSDVRVLSTYSQARFIRKFLKRIRDRDDTVKLVLESGSKTITQIITELDGEMNKVKNAVKTNTDLPESIFLNKDSITDCNMYGLLYHPLGVAVGKFRENREGAIGNTDIIIHDCNIENILTKSLEIRALNSLDGDGLYDTNAQIGPAGDVFQIDKVASIAGKYIKNVLANAQLVVAQSGIGKNERGTTNISPDVVNWALGVNTLPQLLNMTDSNGDKKYYYIGCIDSMGHVQKGNIGLFLSGIDNFTSYNINIRRNINNGELAKEDGGSKCDYMGSVNTGLLITGSTNVFIDGIRLDTIQSTRGNGIGLYIRGESDNITVRDISCDNLKSSSYMNMGKSPNPEPLPSFIKIENNVGKNLFINNI